MEFQCRLLLQESDKEPDQSHGPNYITNQFYHDVCFLSLIDHAIMAFHCIIFENMLKSILITCRSYRKSCSVCVDSIAPDQCWYDVSLQSDQELHSQYVIVYLLSHKTPYFSKTENVTEQNVRAHL